MLDVQSGKVDQSLINWVACRVHARGRNERSSLIRCLAFNNLARTRNRGTKYHDASFHVDFHLLLPIIIKLDNAVVGGQYPMNCIAATMYVFSNVLKFTELGTNL